MRKKRTKSDLVLDIRRLLLFFSFIWLALSSNLALAQVAPKVIKQSAPAWVKHYKPILPGKVPYAEIYKGRYVLHIDKQIKVSENTSKEEYFHSRIYIANESGLEESSQINIRFDPIYENLLLNQLNIIRKDKVISKLQDAEIELLRREKNLEYQVYDGRYTANIIVDDIRVGDVLEYAYTIVGENPIFGGNFSERLRVSWAIPVKKFDVILHWPKQRPFYQKSFKTDFVLEKQDDAQETLYSLSKMNLKGYHCNSETPEWYSPYGYIQMTQLRDWAEVVAWASPLYAAAYEKNPKVADMAQSLVSKLATDEERIMAVLAYVQKEIRYLGIELGVNSHHPSPPHQTLNRRYGDCKDKVVAVIALLNALGIDAKPVLVDTSMIKRKSEFLPDMNVFNHVIVRVDLPQKTFWLDPTRSFQGSDLNQVFQPDYGYGLVIAPGETDLTKMPDNTESFGVKVVEDFKLPADFTLPVTYTVSSTYKGFDAEQMRRQVAEDGTNEIQRRYLDHYRKYYSGVKVRAPLEIKDNKNLNELNVKEYYQISRFWEENNDDKKWGADFYSNIINSYLIKPKQRQRKDPFQISHPENAEQTIYVQLPETWPIEEFVFRENNDYFRFFAEAKYIDAAKLLHLTYRYRSLQDAVSPEMTQDFIDAIDRSEDNLDFYLTKPYHQSTPTKKEDTFGPLRKNLLPFILLGLMGIATLYALTEWVIDLRKPLLDKPVAYYPVSLLKFTILSLITLGLYQLYWFYKQWSFIRSRDDSPIMPIFRTIFHYLWFYSFYRDLREDSIARFGRSYLPAAPLIVLLMAIYIAPVITSSVIHMGKLISLFNFICLLPFVNYIAYVNRTDSAAMIANSKLRPRHLILAVFCGFSLFIFTGTTFHWLPADKVVGSSALPQKSIRFMQRQGLIKHRADLIYFFSDGFWSNQEDGNGVTKDLVFSYWRDHDSNKLIVKTAKYTDIKNIDASEQTSDDDTAVITITTKSGDEFILYASTKNKMHLKFIQEIKKHLSEIQRLPNSALLQPKKSSIGFKIKAERRGQPQT